MTQDRFLKFLENPELLASISYEELKTLTLAYPYAHNLRYLIAIKSRQDNHPEFQRNLAAAAAHSLDRTRLFQILAPKTLAPQPILVKKEEEQQVLELKPIETVQKELQSKVQVAVAVEASRTAVQEAVSVMPPPPPPPPPPVAEKKPEPKEEVLFDFSGLLQKKKVQPDEPAETPPPVKVEIFEETKPVPEPVAEIIETPLPAPEPEPIEHPQAPIEVKMDAPPLPPEISIIPIEEEVPVHETPIFFATQLPQLQQVKPKSEPLPFSIWIEQFNLSPIKKPVSAGLETTVLVAPAVAETVKIVENESEPTPKSNARLLAERSITENKDLVSETLARLYARQGHLEKAVAMYERLCLAIPEKSHYFAAEIEKLKK